MRVRRADESDGSFECDEVWVELQVETEVTRYAENDGFSASGSATPVKIPSTDSNRVTCGTSAPPTRPSTP